MLAAAIALLLAACGSSPQQGSPTPLPQATLQRLYGQAAGTYNTTEAPITQDENAYCPSSSAKADLAKCQAALSADRQATLSYDNALRALIFPAQARGDATKLLNDDAQLETLLQQAATAPSLSAINALTSQIFSLLNSAAADATKLRGDIGLPPASPPPSASAAASA